MCVQVAVELPIDHNPFRTVNLKEDEWGGKVGGGVTVRQHLPQLVYHLPVKSLNTPYLRPLLPLS